MFHTQSPMQKNTSAYTIHEHAHCTETLLFPNEQNKNTEYNKFYDTMNFNVFFKVQTSTSQKLAHLL